MSAKGVGAGQATMELAEGFRLLTYLPASLLPTANSLLRALHDGAAGFQHEEECVGGTPAVVVEERGEAEYALKVLRFKPK